MSKKGKHQTVAKDLKQTVAWLESLNEVKRVIIGISEACRHKYSPGTIRVRQEVLGGLTIAGYSGKGITDIYLNISPPEMISEVIALINEKFPLQ